MIRDSNKMKYYPFIFCLDDADTKNKKMDTNTKKLKGTLKKQKQHKDMTLFRRLALIPTDANLVITQPTIKIEI